MLPIKPGLALVVLAAPMVLASTSHAQALTTQTPAVQSAAVSAAPGAIDIAARIEALDDLAEAERLPAEGHELTRRVLPWFREVDPAGVASTTLDLLHHGIAARAGNRPP